MSRLMRCLVVGMLAFAAPGLALAAPSAPAVTGEITKIVIAPANDPLAKVIKSRLADAYYGAKPDSRAYDDAQKLYFFYGARGFEPVWLSPASGGSFTFSANAEKIMAVFKDAEAEGFRPSDYLTPALDLAAAGSDPDKLAAVETAFSAAALRYAQDAYGGRIRPSDVSSYLVIAPKRINAADMLVKLATSDAPDQVLRDLDPKDREFLALKAALAKFNAGENPETTIILPGPTLKLGMTDPRVPDIRKRLGITAGDPASTAYDADVVDAIKSFQESLGLTVDGVAGPATVAALNGGSNVSKEDIIANMERWRWEPSDLGAFHVMVNIPEFRVAVVDDGETTYSTRVIVGKPTTETPIFSDRIRNIVVNPYWNVPPSIISKEIAPRLATNPGYLASQNMELVSGAKVINAAAVDWSSVSPNNFPFHIRQRPGDDNALGRIKFLFPNQWDIYLHDTPSKSLFGRTYRAFSHGCVRVQNPMDFANALLAHEPSLTAADLEAMYGPSERWVTLKTQIPVHIAYFTLRVDSDGTIRSYGDIYGHNDKLIRLLDARS